MDSQFREAARGALVTCVSINPTQMPIMHAAITFNGIDEANALQEIFTDDKVVGSCASRLGGRWKATAQQWQLIAGQPVAVLGSSDVS